MSSRLKIAEIPLGQGGLNGSKNMSQVPIIALIKADNITYENGTIEKEGGAAKYNSSAISGTPKILAGHDWNHDGGTQRMVVYTDAGALLKDTGAGTFAVTLASGLTTTSGLANFAEGGKEVAANNRKLFIYTGNNAVQVLSADGATTTALSTPPADWSGSNQPTFGLIHENLHWAGGNANDAHRMYYSLITNHEDFTTAGAGSVAIYPGVGEKLVGAVSFKGGMVCFKYPRGIFFVDTSDSTKANWRVLSINKEIGCAGERCYAQVENDIIFLDQNGEIRLLSSIDEFGNVGTRSLSDAHSMGPWFRDNVGMATAGEFLMVYYKTKREVHLACADIGGSDNNLRVVMDFNTPGQVKFRYSSRDTPISMWVREVSGQPELTIGDDAGFVWRLDQEARNADSAGYLAEFQTAHTDLSYVDPKLSTRRKNGKYLELVTEPVGNWDLNVDIYWDGEYHQTVTFDMGSSGAALGSFVLDTDALGGSAINNRKRRITGSGRRISLVGRNSGADQTFSAARMFLHYTVGNEML